MSYLTEGMRLYAGGKIRVCALPETEKLRMGVTEDDAARLVPGTRIRVNGYKAEWSGEVEIVDATFEILDERNSLCESNQ